MNLKNGFLESVMSGFQKLQTIKLPFKLSWKITTAIRSLEPFLKTLTETLNAIQFEYALKDDEGKIVLGRNDKGEEIPNTFQVEPDKIAPFNAAIEAVLEQEVTVMNVQLKLSDFPDTLEIAPEILSLLHPIITE